MTDVVARLRKALGERLRTVEPTRAAHRRDTWVLGELRDFEGHPPPLPLAVVRAQSTEDVAAATKICRDAGSRAMPVGRFSKP